MIQVKLKTKRFRKAKTFELPTSYGELTLEKLLNFGNYTEDMGALVAFLADIPFKIDPAGVEQCLSWLMNPIDLTEFEPSTDLLDIKRQTFGQKVDAHQLLMKNDSLTSAAQLVSIYYPFCNFYKMKLEKFLPMYLGIRQQLEEVLKVEKANLDKPPTAEQIRAGVEEFSKLGYFNTIDDLAGGDPLKYNDILKLEYIVVYHKLLKNKISTTFGERYAAILREQK